jgi:hypothetical protein
MNNSDFTNSSGLKLKEKRRANYEANTEIYKIKYTWLLNYSLQYYI